MKLAKFCSLRYSLLLQTCGAEKIKCLCLIENTVEDPHPEQVEKLCSFLNSVLITVCNSFFAASLDYLQAELVSHLCSFFFFN